MGASEGEAHARKVTIVVRVCETRLMTTRDELENRRRQIAEAALRVLARDGLLALSVRNVAAEADLAPSSLRYAVPTQADLREQAMELLLARLQERIDAVGDPEDEQWARSVLLELIPLDATRRIEMEVMLELGTAAMSAPELMPVYLRGHEIVRSACERAVRVLLGEAATDVETDRLHGLVDGLALHIVRLPPEAGAERAVAALDLHLHQLTAR